MADAFRRAIVQILKPLVKALIDEGVTFPIMCDLLRKAYVEVAHTEYRIRRRRPTDSRIAMLTGLYRKEVKRLRSEEGMKQGPGDKLSLSAKVIAVWCSKPEYLDEKGYPLALPKTAPEGNPSLEQLMVSVSGDVRPRTLLQEWLRSGIVELSDDRVKLIRTALIPNVGFEEKVYFFGRNLRDHIAAGTHNLSNIDPVFFDRSVYYNRISPESVEELRKLCAQRGEELLLEINRHTRRLAERDRAVGEPKGRMTFGAYFYAEDNTSAVSDEET